MGFVTIGGRKRRVGHFLMGGSVWNERLQVLQMAYGWDSKGY